MQENAPDPVPAADEVLVQVQMAGLNPLDFKIRDGSSGLAKDLPLPAGTGRELVGTVIGAGEGLDDTELAALGLSVGTRVFGMRRNSDRRGTVAEKAALLADDLAPLPAGSSDEDLPVFAGLALAGLTALAVIEDCAQISEGQTVLVHGGTGGVGQLLIPLALAAGASTVWATGRAENAERIRSLGATPIAYDQQDWQEEIMRATEGRGVDAVLDTHYHRTFVPSLDVVAEGGIIVPLPSLADLTPATEHGIRAVIPQIVPGRERLDRLVALHREGTINLEVSQVLPIEEIQQAHRLLEEGHTRGKIVVQVSR